MVTHKDNMKVNGRGGARIGSGRKPTAPQDRNESILVQFTEPVPCCIRKPTASDLDAICGKPATVGWSWHPDWRYLDKSYPGVWIVQPVCRECAEAAARVYEE